MYYSEIGIGNKNFISTEVEVDNKEYRINRFIIKQIRSYYIRLWIFKVVFIFDTKEFCKICIKNKNNFKVLFGIVSQ